MLGPFDVVDNGNSIPLGGAKQRALLVMLAIHANEVVSVDRLIDELWGEHPPTRAPSTLQTYVSRLRRVVDTGDGVSIAFGSGGYVLRADPASIDAQRFARDLANAQGPSSAEERSRKLRAALELWRGPALADFRFAPFARGEIERLEELRLSALEYRIEADLACGRHAELVPELERLVAEHPWRERLRQQLMLALYRSGRQADALEAYRSGRRLLVDELGIEPGRALQELERGILAHDPALDPPGGRLTRRKPRARWIIAAAVLVASALAAGAIALLRDGPSAARMSVVVRPHSLAVIDPATNEVVANPRIGGWPMSVMTGGNYVWAANTGDDTVSRVDPARRLVLDSFFATTPLDVVWRNGVIWIANGNSYDSANPPGGGTVERYDVATQELVQTRIAPPADNLLTFVAAGTEGVWAGDPSGARVVRLDPGTGRILAQAPQTIQVSGMAVGLGSLWVSDAINNVVYRIDPNDEKRFTAIHVSDGPRRLAVGENAVWVVGEFPHSGVWRIDPRVNRAVTHIPVPERANYVAVGAGSVWVTSRTPGHVGPGSVSRIDPKTNNVVATTDLGFSPQGVVVANGLVWVAVGPM
jgi:DNA-binding SARP family transcriptional activator/DNA-binding beta-propeller fold protein YncE